MPRRAPPKPSPKCDSLKFAFVCDALDKTVAAKGSKRKVAILLPARLKTWIGEESCYSFLRLICPELDRARAPLGMKHAVLARCYVDALGLNVKHSKATKLLNYRDPTLHQGNTGDLSLIIEEQLASKCGGGKELTVADINREVDALSTDHSKEGRQKIFTRLLEKLSAREHKWLVRIVLKDMGIGVKAESILSFIHPDATNIYNLTTDIAHVVEKCTRTTARVRTELALNSVIAPMLAKRATALEPLGKKMVGQRFAFESKLDGERMIVHKKGNEIKMFTRNGNDYTSKYADAMRPWILSQLNARDAIIDGEILCWNDARGKVIEFGNNLKVAAEQMQKEAQGESPSQWMLFMVFDLLYCSGGEKLAAASRELAAQPHLRIDADGIDGDMTMLPLEARRGVLEHVLTPYPHRLELVVQTVVEFDDAQRCIKELREQVDRARDELKEGVMLKDMGAP